MMENPLVGGVLQGWKQLLQRVKDHIHTLQCPGFEIFYVNFGIYIYMYIVNSTVPAVTLPVAGGTHLHVWLYRAQDRSGGRMWNQNKAL